MFIPDYMAPRRNLFYGKPIDICEAAKELSETASTIKLIKNSGEYEDASNHLRFLISHAKDLVHAIEMQLDVPGIKFAPDETDMDRRKSLTELYLERTSVE